jgi:hypothetical protein
VQPLKELQQINLFTNACISVLLQLAMFLVFKECKGERWMRLQQMCIYISSALNELQLEATLAANIADVHVTEGCVIRVVTSSNRMSRLNT